MANIMAKLLEYTIRKAQEKRDEELGWKSWEEAWEVVTNWTEWKRLVEALRATQAQMMMMMMMMMMMDDLQFK